MEKENRLIKDRIQIRKLSETLDDLIKRFVGRGLHDPELENQIRELNEMMKSLDSVSDCSMADKDQV